MPHHAMPYHTLHHTTSQQTISCHAIPCYAIPRSLAGIGAGLRTQHFKASAKILGSVYAFLPSLIDGVILKMVKKTHHMNGQGR